MSIAEKLVTVAENVPKVFNAGQLSVISNAEALKGSASGTDIITIADTSPVEHELSVQIASDTVTDLSAVTLRRYGKNLSDLGTFEINRSKNFDLPYVLPAGTYTVSGILDTTYPKDYALIQFQYTDDTWYNQCGFNIAGEGRKHAYAYLSKPVKRLSIHAGPGYAASAGHTATYTDFMIERGSTATDYEPYIEPVECTANADGTVEGVKSLYPNMTLISNLQGVIITANYIKDIDKTFEERLAELEAAIVNNE